MCVCVREGGNGASVCVSTGSLVNGSRAESNGSTISLSLTVMCKLQWPYSELPCVACQLLRKE